tara:strand:+ start:2412 stop:2582 length:171 start_codon:yes stop_codon:yes gene_type:complete
MLFYIKYIAVIVLTNTTAFLSKKLTRALSPLWGTACTGAERSEHLERQGYFLCELS